MEVKDIMHSGDALPVCRCSTSVGQALITMTTKSLGCIGIVNDAQKLVGIITDTELARHMSFMDNVLNQPTSRITSPGRRSHARGRGYLDGHAKSKPFQIVCGPSRNQCSVGLD
jgi:signal-transduction protein with cAMP-binding, CBS, and nucleotidyltransferase domain